MGSKWVNFLAFVLFFKGRPGSAVRVTRQNTKKYLDSKAGKKRGDLRVVETF